VSRFRTRWQRADDERHRAEQLDWRSVSGPDCGLAGRARSVHRRFIGAGTRGGVESGWRGELHCQPGSEGIGDCLLCHRGRRVVRRPAGTAGESYIDGIDSEVLYAGVAPGLVTGALQVNVRVPMAASKGGVVLRVGERESQAGVFASLRE